MNKTKYGRPEYLICSYCGNKSELQIMSRQKHNMWTDEKGKKHYASSYPCMNKKCSNYYLK